jgi:transcriptional regulator with XRE-family HTH domain
MYNQRTSDGQRPGRPKPHDRQWSQRVDAQAVRDHIRALRCNGVGNKQLSKLIGTSHTTIQIILTGRRDRQTGPSPTVLRRTAEKILAVPIPTTPHRLVAGGQRVASLGITRRLQALVALGYSRCYLCRQLGIAATNGHKLFGNCVTVNASTARAVEALFERLQMRRGPSQRARAEAKRLGWAPPLAWDEDAIDDPAAVADICVHQRISFPDRYLELSALGLVNKQIAQRLGITVESLERQLYRHGLRGAA